MEKLNIETVAKVAGLSLLALAVAMRFAPASVKAVLLGAPITNTP
jgi:hypothetical protein